MTKIGAAAMIIASIALSGSGLADFESADHEFTAQYPSEWRLAGMNAGLRIFNFPLSTAVRGAVIPNGGAMVQVTTASERAGGGPAPHSLDDWVALGTLHQRVVTKRTLRIEDGRRSFTVVEANVQCCAVPPFQDSVEWFFQVDGRMFEADVTFWQGDGNVSNFVDVMKRVVLSLAGSRR